jgi:Protein of unknown function (DUF4240)
MLRRKFTALLALSPAAGLGAASRHRATMSMTEDEFWQLIESARGAGGDEQHAKRLVARLSRLDARGIVAFALAYESKLDLADTGPVWAAGVLLNGGHGSDDGFLYFRHWLIGQGRAIYSNALSDPDTLSKVDIVATAGAAHAEWESFGASADTAYRRKTKRGIYAKMKRTDQPLPEWDWSEYDDAYMSRNLPQLWSLYGHHKAEFDKRVRALVAEREERATKAEVDVPGLGVIKAGVLLVHRSFGSGTVLGVEPILSGAIVTMKFGESVHHLHVNSNVQHLLSRPK